MNTFQITQKLNTVYPDIEGQLCSKHSTLLSNISHSFNKVYPLHNPTHFIVTKLPLVLAHGKHCRIEMAMEQGITVMLAAADQQQKINIWTNNNEQIFVQNNGKIINIESEQKLALLVSRAINLAVQDLSLLKMKGGFVYLHMPAIFDLSSKQNVGCILIAFFIAALTINALIDQYSLDDLISKLNTLQQFKHNQMVQNYFRQYRNRELLVTGPSTHHVKVEKKYKFIMLSLACFNQHILNIINDDAVDQLIGQLAAGKITFIQLANQLAQVNSINENSQINNFIKSVKTQFNIKTAFYVQKYCVFVVQSYRYTQLIGKLSQLIHTQLQSNPQQTDELYNKSKATISRLKMQSILFSSMPSNALSIIDPRNAMWM